MSRKSYDVGNMDGIPVWLYTFINNYEISTNSWKNDNKKLWKNLRCCIPSGNRSTKCWNIMKVPEEEMFRSTDSVLNSMINNNWLFYEFSKKILVFNNQFEYKIIYSSFELPSFRVNSSPSSASKAFTVIIWTKRSMRSQDYKILRFKI